MSLFLIIAMIFTLLTVPTLALNNNENFDWYEADKYVMCDEAIVLLQKLEQRLQNFTPILPRNEVQIPEGGLTSLLIELPPLDTSHLETEYRNGIIMYTYESWEWVLAENERRAKESLTDEFIAYVEAISAEIDFISAQYDIFIEALIAEMAFDFERLDMNIDMFLPLNTGNRIRDLFNRTDGLSNAQMTRIVNLGNSAAVAAAWEFPIDAARQDAYRHYLWTRFITIDFGLEVARIGTNNHEWADLMWRHHNNPNAFTDAQLISRRQQMRITAAGSQIGFNGYMFYDHVMDFWNNREGATCALNGNRPPYRPLFDSLWNSGRLIRADQHIGNPAHRPTPAQMSSLRTSTWWRHF